MQVFFLHKYSNNACTTHHRRAHFHVNAVAEWLNARGDGPPVLNAKPVAESAVRCYGWWYECCNTPDIR